MSCRYSDTLQIERAVEPGFNELGDLEQAATRWETIGVCRDEPATGGSTINTGNGEVVSYSSNVFAPFLVFDIPDLARIRIIDNKGNIIIQGTCKRFKRYSGYVKIWI